MKKLLCSILILTMTLSIMIFTPAASAEEDPIALRFVVASDVHVTDSRPGNAERLPMIFDTAYDYAENHSTYKDIDAFVFNGDSVDGSTTAGVTASQWETFLTTVNANIKTGSKLMLSLARTHDIWDANVGAQRITESTFNTILQNTFGDNSAYIAADWGFQNHVTKLNGYAIITMTNDLNANSYDGSEAWLKEQLDALIAENSEQPIFVVCHYPETGTLGHTARWGATSLKDTLDQYPQVIAINAHVHWDPRMPDSIWQDTYTAVYDGASAYTVYPNGTTIAQSDYELSDYSIIEVTESGAVSIRYMNTLTGELLTEGNGSGETLIYRIPKAWDQSTWLYREDEHRSNAETPWFEADADIRLENGNTLVFDRAVGEETMVYYKIELFDGTATQTSYLSSQFYEDRLPDTLSAGLGVLEAGKTYLATVTGVNGWNRETANRLTLSFTTEEGDLKSEQGISAPAASAITIGSAEALADILKQVAEGETFAGKTLVQTADIDLSQMTLEPAGTFMGTLDGNGFTITGIFAAGSGLFHAAENAAFQNLNLCGTVINDSNAGAVAGTAENCSFVNCMNGVVVISRNGNAASYAAAAEGCVFRNCIYDGSLLAASGATIINESVNASGNEVTVEGNQLIFHTGAGDIRRSLFDSSRHIDWSFESTLHTADEFIRWALGGGSAAALAQDIDLGLLEGRFARIAGLGLTFPVTLSGNYCVIQGGNATLSGTIANLGCTQMTVEGGTNCWDAADFTAAELASGAAAYQLGSWAQSAEGFPAGEGTVVRITYSTGEIMYVNAGTRVEVQIPYGYSADQTAFTATEDCTVVLTAHTADKSALGNAVDTLGGLNAEVFTDAAAYTAAVAAARDVLNDAAATQEETEAAAAALASALEALELSNVYPNYPEFAMHEVYTELFGEISKWSIGTRADLEALSVWSKSNNGSGMEFHMTADIDMENRLFDMISTNDLPFAGVFDGHLHTVSNLLIDSVNIDGAGFFVAVTGAVIRNFGIESGLVRGTVKHTSAYVDNAGIGAIAGRAIGGTSFRHVWNNAFVTYNANQVDAYYSTGKTWEVCVGGLVGRSQSAASFVGCYNTGNVFGGVRASGLSNWSQSGGNATRISNCFNTGKIMVKTGGVTEAIARYGANTTYNSYFSYNNYYLEGCATGALSASGTIDDFTAKAEGAELPVALSAQQINTGLAELLNAKRYTGFFADAANWVQGENGHPVIASIDESGEAVPFSDYENNTAAPSYSISSAAELNAFAAVSKSRSFENVTIYLRDDIDMSGTESFAMIGTTSVPFEGIFDGMNHTITGLKLTATSNSGMFVKVSGGTVKNFIVEGASSSGQSCTGLIAGYIEAGTLLENVHVRNSTVSTTVSPSKYDSGFLVGQSKTGSADNRIYQCSASGNTFAGAGIQGFGGIIGRSSDTVIDHCYVINNTMNTRSNSGLIVGFAEINYKTAIRNCYTYGNTLTANTKQIATAIGQTRAGCISSIENCVFAEADLSLIGWDNEIPAIDQVYTINSVFCAADSTKTDVYTTVITEESLNSGAVAYALGWAMKNGRIAFTDADTPATVRYTYWVEDETYAVRYTESTGAVIGSVADPEKDGCVFEGWIESADGERGDKCFTALFALLHDVSGDGAVNTDDVTLLMQYLNGWDVEIHSKATDINSDGRLSIADAVLLLQSLSK
ncbi:MAG: hypothetical protein DBX52_04295 [Clostridiales bacterium]|nr:MAG: hypothetical protein DBX52_04295 [Clostridiales bacterium]